MFSQNISRKKDVNQNVLKLFSKLLSWIFGSKRALSVRASGQWKVRKWTLTRKRKWFFFQKISIYNFQIYTNHSWKNLGNWSNSLWEIAWTNFMGENKKKPYENNKVFRWKRKTLKKCFLFAEHYHFRRCRDEEKGGDSSLHYVIRNVFIPWIMIRVTVFGIMRCIHILSAIFIKKQLFPVNLSKTYHVDILRDLLHYFGFDYGDSFPKMFIRIRQNVFLNGSYCFSTIF